MTILYMDGFDSYNNTTDIGAAGYTTSGGAFATNLGRFGGGCFRENGGNGIIQRPIGSTETDVWLSFAVNFATSSGDLRFAGFSSGLGDEVTFTFNASTGEMKAWRGNIGTSLGTTGTAAMTLNAWHWIELRAVFSPTAGVIEIWIDGVQKLSLSSQNTRNNSTATGFTLWSLGNLAGVLTTLFDDVILLNTSGSSPQNTRLGDCKITLQAPTSDATPNNGTLSTGTTHWGVVDEKPVNTTDYTDLTATTGQEERFGIAALAAGTGNIYGVRVVAYMQKTDAGACTVHNELVSSSTVGSGASNPLSTSFAFKSDIWALDPNGSIAWTSTAVNAAKIGVVVE